MSTKQLVKAEASAALAQRARAVTPGGVNSPVRAMGSVGREFPLFVERAAGATIVDADGTEFTDWIMSWGALPLGHAHPAVVTAASEALAGGSSFGAPTRREVELAELIVELVPGVERVRFTSSGTEATMSALRVARAATGRDLVLTFAGCYHGHADPFLATGGSGLATLGIPASPGVPAATAATTIVDRYGDLERVEQIFAERGAEIAAIFLEPVAANMGVVEPGTDYLAGLRRICDEHGALLVFDEVITGFRLGAGGAQERFGVQPDLSCFGKVIGGGLPVGAFGGRAELLDLVAPAGSVYQAGTLSGNPAAMAAGLAALRTLRDTDGWTQLDTLGALLARELREVVDRTGANCAVSQVGSLVTLFHLGELDATPRNFDEAGRLDTAAFARTHAAALAGGHMLPPSQFEALFVSTQHTAEHVSALADAVEACLREEDAT